MKKKELIKNSFYLLNEVSDLKYQLELEKLENKKLRKQLSIYGVSGMFSEKHLIQAYNDGMEAEQQRCDNFDIENYR